MARIVVCGGSMIGLSAAIMLAGDGHEVVVLERDPDGPPPSPATAWQSWDRHGVAQFRQPHNLFTRFRHICDEEMPGLTERLLAAGCGWEDYLATPPPTLPQWSPRPDDAAWRFVTGRRPVVEAVVAAAADEQPGVVVRRGERISCLLTGRTSPIPGVPHVIGVRTATGEDIRADLVVDATGRRTPVMAWLGALGAVPPRVESENQGFAYYSRFFRGPSQPERVGRALTPMGTVSALVLHNDNDTWSVTLFGLSDDAALKALRRPEVFTRVVAACPLQAHWLDGTPITDVVTMAGILDRYRRFVVDGQPVVTGFVAVGDAWACTNPSAGRGLSVGLIHAQLLRRVVGDHLDDPDKLARAWDEQTEALVTPYYRNQVAADRARVAEMRTLRHGGEALPPSTPMQRMAVAASYDADVFRALVETVLCLALPQEVLERPGLRARIDELSANPPLPVPGPDREQLLHLLST